MNVTYIKREKINGALRSSLTADHPRENADSLPCSRISDGGESSPVSCKMNKSVQVRRVNRRGPEGIRECSLSRPTAGNGSSVRERFVSTAGREKWQYPENSTTRVRRRA